MADNSLSSLQSPGRIMDEWKGLWQAQYRLLRFLDQSRVKKAVVGLVLIYVCLGMLSIAFHLDLVCLSPNLVTRSSDASLLQRSDPNFAFHEADSGIEHDNHVLLQISHVVLDGELRNPRTRIGRAPGGAVDVKPKLLSLECLSPTSPHWQMVLFAIGVGCCIISSLLVFEHLLRMSSTTLLYYFRNWWLLLDFTFAFSSWIGDFLILAFLQPKLFLIWETTQDVTNKLLATLEMTIIILRLVRLGLINRTYRFVRAEWNPASEIARTMELIELLKNDMPHVDLLSVQVVRNNRAELRAYEHRKQTVQNVSGAANEMLLFFGSRSVPPEKITDSAHGLDAGYATPGDFGVALYGSLRPTYTDCCYSYTDWDNDETGQTRQMVIFLALTGQTIDANEESGPTPTRTHSRYFDSVCGGPLEPTEYCPERIGLPRRDVSSIVYGMPEPRGQTLPIAIVTYRNPDAFEEIEALSAVGAKSWIEHYETSVDLPSLNPKHAAALKSLEIAIDEGDLESTSKALKNCTDVGASPHDVHAVKQQKKHESESAGVCLAYVLSDTFKELAQQATGVDDPSFQEMGQVFFTQAPSKGISIGAGTMCPRDLRLGCAYVDTLPSHHRKKATLFLSWVWRYKLNMLQNALCRWIEIHNVNPDEEFLYVCFFCNNQYRILVTKEASGSDDMEKLFGNRLTSIGRVIAVMDTWEDALYLKRIWTIYEQYMAAKLNIDAEFVLPDEPAATLMEELETGKNGIMHVINAISHVDAESAEASMVEDERKVKDLIRKDIGFATVNSVVQKRITAWMSKEFKKKIDKMVAEVQRSI